MPRQPQPIPLHRAGPALHPAARGRVRLLLPGLAVLYLLLLGVLTGANAAGPEQWWWSTLNLYLPQWIWLLPGGVLLPLMLGFTRRWAWLPIAAMVWVSGSLMGLAVPLGAAAAAPEGGQPLRMMTYNIEWWRRPFPFFIEDAIRTAAPDLLLLQDARGAMDDAALAETLEGWHTRAEGQYVVASRFPIRRAELRAYDVPGEVHTYMRAELEVGSRAVAVYNVHLLTPRDGLSAMRHMRLGGIPYLEENALYRMAQAASVARNVREETGPVLLGGDLNAPEPSLVVRRLAEQGLFNVFSRAGWGYGYTHGHTLRLGHSFLRIDHLMASSHWSARRCRTGSAEGSDHRPVIADLVLQP